MIVKDKDGREIYVSVYGQYEDDIQINEAYYVDSEDEVSDETIEYIQSNYASELYQEWYENKIAAAEAMEDR